MKPDTLLSQEFHFVNFNQEDLATVIDFDALEELPDTPATRHTLLLLSQYLVGNVSETFAEVKALELADRRRLLQRWAKLLNSADNLRGLVIDTSTHLVD